jgi:hypothetical protein
MRAIANQTHKGMGSRSPDGFIANLPNPGTCRSNPLACDLTTVTERRGDAVHRDRDADVEDIRCGISRGLPPPPM